MLDFNISIFPGAAGAVADASVLAEVSATPASAETVLARSLSALLEAGSAVRSAPLAWATSPFHQVMGGAAPLPFPRLGTARRRPLLRRVPDKCQTPAARGEEHGDPP